MAKPGVAGPPLDIDSFIRKLLDAKAWQPRAKLNAIVTATEIARLCKKAQQIFNSQPMLLELEAPVKICGDIHGQYYDLIKLFERCGYPPDSNYLFLGDYVDRGRQSIETICLLLAYKIKYPENFFLLRGNHECPSINWQYGFLEECKARYNVRTYRIFNDCFQFMPVAAIVDNRIFCCHGGLSPHLTTMNQIQTLKRERQIPDDGLLCDLLWSDPSPEVRGFAENDRGISCLFGKDVVSTFIDQYDLQLVCRAHMVVEDGYEFFANRKLVTIFSAPNYCGEFDNAASVMDVRVANDQLMCSFTILRPKEIIRKIVVKPQPTAATPPKKEPAKKPVVQNGSMVIGQGITEEGSDMEC